MEVKYQSSQSCSVQREGNELWITSVLMSTVYEATVNMKVNVNTLQINNARWDIYRTPGSNIVRHGEIPVLIGTHALEYSARLVLPTLDPHLSGILAELISECIRGVRQSESFIIKELGYPSYEKFMEGMYQSLLNSCICFSNLDRVGMFWSDYMDEQSTARTTNLFNRHKNYHIGVNPDGSLFSTACFADSFHEILLNLSFLQGGEVKKISGKFLRSPDDVCYGSMKHINNIVGKKLAKMTKKEMGEFLGGPSGCTHILEMCYDLGMILSEQYDQILVT